MKKETLYMPLVWVFFATLIRYFLAGKLSDIFLFSQISVLVGAYLMRWVLIRHYEEKK